MLSSNVMMRCQIVSLLSGFAWFFVAGVIGYAIPIFGKFWLPHLVDALITGLFVGNVMYPLISRCFGKPGWYALPFLSIFLGAGLFGLLLPLSWEIIGRQGLEDGIILHMLLIIMIESFFFLWILYPLALLNNWII